MKNKVVSAVCGAMFGEERVNNLAALLSRLLIAFSIGQIFSVGCCNPLSLRPFTRKDFVRDCQTSRRPDGTVMRLSGLLIIFMGCACAVTHVVSCCNLLLRTLECYRTRLACFVFETNQHFVIAGLCSYFLDMFRR